MSCGRAGCLAKSRTQCALEVAHIIPRSTHRPVLLNTHNGPSNVRESRLKVLIRVKQRQVRSAGKAWMSKGIKSADLDTPAAAGNGGAGGGECDPAYGLKERRATERRSTELVTVFWGRQNPACTPGATNPGVKDLVGTLERGPECTHLQARLLAITAKSQRTTSDVVDQHLTAAIHFRLVA